MLLPLPLPGPYDYRLPSGATLEAGRFVTVPLGRREVRGVVWDADGPGGPVPDAKLKDVTGVLDAPPLPYALRRLVDWVAAYTVTPPGAVLRMAMSVPSALEPPRPQVTWRLSGRAPATDFRMTPARRRILAVLEAGPPRGATELAREAGVSTSVVKGLADTGLLEPVTTVARPFARQPDWRHRGPELSADQAVAAETLRRATEAGGFAVTVLDGVTGSGKTEVYLESVAAALKAGRQVLVLLPEIALSTQWLERFARRFGARPAEWHSDLTQKERRTAWRAVAEGEARVVVGARSALFLPFAELGLIVVDEEHDAAYKQEDGVIYHARDMAVVRARLEDHPIVLASATPSLETVVNVAQSRYAHVCLPGRFGTAPLPEIELVDLRKSPPPRDPVRGPAWLSQPLRAALSRALEAGDQAMLFLNRRGYAPLTLCDACGHRLKCPDCTAWLVEHRLGGSLTCHHCGYATRLPAHCPACGAEHPFRACGPGVERIAEEARALFAEARVAIVSSDTINGPLAAAAMISAIEERQVDLLVGTQILAKGHHFPMLTLVGVVDADLGLFGGDLRAAERTFQLLQQVAGRAGRAERPGRVLVQTHEPEHPVMQALAANDRERFLAVETAHRKRDRLPPFARYAALVVSAPSGEQADAVARQLAQTAPRSDEVRILGPAPAVLSVLRGRHRRRFLVKAPRSLALQPLLRRWLSAVKVPSAARIQVDIDPYSFL